jgi:hypothetical protein
MRNPLTLFARVSTVGLLLGATAVGCGGDDDAETTTSVDGIAVEDAGAADGRVRLGVAHVGDTATTSTAFTVGISIALPGESAQTVELGLRLDSTSTVSEVAADGGYTVQQTIDQITVDEAPEGVDLDELEGQYAALQGATLEQTYDANGVAGESHIVDEESLPAEAREAAQDIEESASTATIFFPTEEIGVGARWSATQTTSKQGFDLTVTYEYELTALAGDDFEIAITYDDDIDQQATQDGTTFDVTGSISGGGTASGSVANPLDVSATVDQTLDMDLENDGDTAEFEAAYHVEVVSA